MSDQPLQPFSPPTALFQSLHLTGIVSQEHVVWGILFLVCVYWLVYTIVASYHWFRYSHATWLTVPAIAVHLMISYALIVYALTGTLTIPFL